MNNLQKGQIFWAKDYENHKHPIVFLKAEDDEKFLACILSKTNTNGNKPMLETHFLNKKEDGTNYSIKFKNSHLVHTKVLIKEYAWLKRLRPDGMLTEAGLDFIDANLENVVPQYLSIDIKTASEKK
ncbi:hypothetical protein [Chryseobacterium sp. 18068]|uniref:hypothetical protein n=1 Tax=Chryseobacterium sp. 18068 TaxID=2681414 RepID=UPI001359FB12|nr:hypothetical protein [Chryseobacterium sp. 18068]